MQACTWLLYFSQTEFSLRKYKVILLKGHFKGRERERERERQIDRQRQGERDLCIAFHKLKHISILCCYHQLK